MLLKRNLQFIAKTGFIGCALALATNAQGECETPDQLGAVPLELVEPSGEPDGTYAVYWKAELPWRLKADLTPSLGSEFDIIRCLPPGKWVFVGAGTVRNITGSLGEGFARSFAARAKTTNGTPTEFETRSSNLYWRPMGGDLILPRQYKIARQQRITPKKIFAYENLFSRESGNTFSAELSQVGKASLVEIVNQMRGSTGRLGVEVFSNRAGNREALREDTQTRANIVARYIMQSFGLSDAKVIAIGLGSSGLAAEVQDASAWPVAPDTIDGVVVRILPE